MMTIDGNSTGMEGKQQVPISIMKNDSYVYLN
jgi:hypothetical protein